MQAETRTCHHTDCSRDASTALSLRYQTRQVWLRPLGTETHPAIYELCAAHADRLTVPRGWELVDERRPRAAPEPEETHQTPQGLNDTDVVSYASGGDPG